MTYSQACGLIRPLFENKILMEQAIIEHRTGHPEWNWIDAAVSLHKTMTTQGATNDTDKLSTAA